MMLGRTLVQPVAAPAALLGNYRWGLWQEDIVSIVLSDFSQKCLPPRNRSSLGGVGGF